MALKCQDLDRNGIGVMPFVDFQKEFLTVSLNFFTVVLETLDHEWTNRIPESVQND